MEKGEGRRRLRENRAFDQVSEGDMGEAEENRENAFWGVLYIRTRVLSTGLYAYILGGGFSGFWVLVSGFGYI